MQNPSLLLYINLSGEVFYIIAHRMKSQKVADDLQQRVYNDLATCICHPTVIQNILKGSLQTLELSLADVRILMDRIVHSSIMTVNAYSMEKLFELTLIATRYQYTVCQYPTDILIIAINHLEKIRKCITDPVGIQLTENVHKIILERMRHLDAFTMQGYRYAILTYLADVRLKMTNLIKLGMQKPTGEFVKNLPDRLTRPELRKPGVIEIDEAYRNNSLEEESDSESESTGEFQKEDPRSTLDDGEESVGLHDYRFLQDDEDDFDFPPDMGCHFDQIAVQLNNYGKYDSLMEEEDEILEIEWAEESCEHEGTKPMEGSYIIRFHPHRRASVSTNQETTSLDCSLELSGFRNITLGQSIYDIPGNSDDDIKANPDKPSSSQMSHFTGTCTSKALSSSFHYDGESSSMGSLGYNTQVMREDPMLIDPKAMQGLDLCSIMLGCKTEKKTPSDNTRESPALRLQGFEAYEKADLSAAQAGFSKSPIAGVNFIKFDARTDRASAKAELAKISRQFDLEDMDEESSRSKIDPFANLDQDEVEDG